MALSRRALLAGAESTHIASLVVHCRPEKFVAAEEVIAAMPGVEVPASDDNSKLVVLLELKEVVSATLVFHQVEEL